MQEYFKKLTTTSFWKSIFRTGWPVTNLGRAYVMFNSLILHIHPVKVQRAVLRFKTTFGLGVLSFGLFAALTVTGVLLMLYYHPSVPQAYGDMKELEFVITGGRFLRNMHRWAAHAMVFIVFLHMLRVYSVGGFRPPKQFNWVVGVLLLAGTLILSYTGYLLPWDQLAYWAVNVGTNMVQTAPIVGEPFRYLLLGGNYIGENALVRFYVLHCVILPLALTFGIAVHFWRIRKDGGLTLSRSDARDALAVPPMPPLNEEQDVVESTRQNP
jgi:quinol-cytochrome oxidoreductase complex cytochrome b subunit